MEFLQQWRQWLGPLLFVLFVVCTICGFHPVRCPICKKFRWMAKMGAAFILEGRCYKCENIYD